MLVRIFRVLSRLINSSWTSFRFNRKGVTRLTLIRLSQPSTKRSLFNRKDSFISLLILFLNTASPTCLRTVTAIRFDSYLFLWMRREKWFVSEHFIHRVFLKSPLLSLSSFVRVKEVIRFNDQWQASINMLIKTTRNSLHYKSNLYGKAFSTLCASSSYYVSARSSSHSHKKAVCSSSALVVRLVCPLHALSPQSDF
jgi:hypothetical protein